MLKMFLVCDIFFGVLTTVMFIIVTVYMLTS